MVKTIYSKLFLSLCKIQLIKLTKTIKIRTTLKLKLKINNFLLAKPVRKNKKIMIKTVWSESLRGYINDLDLWLKSDCSIFLIISIQKMNW